MKIERTSNSSPGGIKLTNDQLTRVIDTMVNNGMKNNDGNLTGGFVGRDRDKEYNSEEDEWEESIRMLRLIGTLGVGSVMVYVAGTEQVVFELIHGCKNLAVNFVVYGFLAGAAAFAVREVVPVIRLVTTHDDRNGGRKTRQRRSRKSAGRTKRRRGTRTNRRR